MKYVVAACLLALIALPWMILRAQKARRIEQEHLESEREAVRVQEEATIKEESARLDDLQRDPETRTSILEGLRVRIGRPPEARAVVRVDIEKLPEARFVVDDIGRSCTVLLDGKPLVRFGGDGRDSRMLLDRTVASSHHFLRLGQDLPEGEKLEVEWRNRNPRTGQTETLRVGE